MLFSAKILKNSSLNYHVIITFDRVFKMGLKKTNRKMADWDESRSDGIRLETNFQSISGIARAFKNYQKPLVCIPKNKHVEVEKWKFFHAIEYENHVRHTKQSTVLCGFTGNYLNFAFSIRIQYMFYVLYTPLKFCGVNNIGKQIFFTEIKP